MASDVWERWACLTMSAALGAEVEIHDDNSRDSMYDLEVRYPTGRRAAAEVVSATDGDSVALWKLMNPPGERWIEPTLAGGWILALDPMARAKDVRRFVPIILRLLEAAGVNDFEATGRHGEWAPARQLHQLGVRSAYRGGTEHPGSVYVTIERDSELTGGSVDESGAPMATWIGGYLSAPQQGDVLSKLARAGADERHVFVVVPGFSTAPFGVSDLLMRGDYPPQDAPDLPEEVTHVWVASTWNVPNGLRWSPGAGWEWFDSLVDPAA